MPKSRKSVSARARDRARFEPVTPPFRLRAILLALVTALVALAALVLLLTDRGPRKPRLVPIPSASAEAWPEGFVEWQGPETSGSAAPSASAAPGPAAP